MRSMGKIWYECRLNFDVMSILPFIFLGAIILLPILMSNNLKKKGSVPISEIKKVKIFFSCMITFAGIFNLIYIISQIDLYKKTVIAYRNGDYQIVEGYVENFEPMDSNGWPPEKFEINGVKFEYSHHWSIPAGYRREKGDCMIGNGQHLKVGYVHSGRSWGNIIVYIEELP